MKRKSYDLSEEDLAVLKQIQEECEWVNTEVAAIRFLIRKYKYDILDPLEEKLREQQELNNTIKQMRTTLNIAERNTEILLDAANTLLFNSNEEHGILQEEFRHPLIELSEKKIKEKIAHNKQKKDFRKG